jgi:hypothetical protein
MGEHPELATASPVNRNLKAVALRLEAEVVTGLSNASGTVAAGEELT